MTGIGKINGNSFREHFVAFDWFVAIDDLMIRRQQEFDAGVFASCLDLPSCFQHFIFHERLPYGEPFGLQKRVRHGPADQKLVDFTIDERINDWNLVRNFSTAEDRDEGMLRIGDHAAEIIQLLLHQQPGRSLFNELCDSGRRGVRPMRRAESIVDIQAIAQRSELLCELFVVLFFFGVETKILEQENVSVAHLLSRLLYFLAYTIFRKIDRWERMGAYWAVDYNFGGGSAE